MANPLLTSINRAVYDNKQLAIYFGRYLGTKEHPRGRLLSLYRNARRAMEMALRDSQITRTAVAGEVLSGLQIEATAVLTQAMNESVALGAQSAAIQAEAYETAGIAFRLAQQRPNINTLASAPIALLSQQMTAVNSLIASGAAPTEIIGDSTRLGLLQPAPVQREAARWMAQAVSDGFSNWVMGSEPGGLLPFRRQAVAAIDERTTDCCLRVHGQIVGLDEDFTLTGTPRYADKQQNPPFHDYCRTSTTLYLSDFDEGYTDLMRKAARLETELRGSDNYRAPHPANAFTRVRE